MSFAEPFKRRFTEIIEPAIQDVTYHGTKLLASRVDLSKTGDSILTDIIDGIAHAVMVLADVSVIGNDAKTGETYRNGNVMYEVGLALASRQSGEVLLIRDDKAPFLFDVSTVPHKHIDFSEPTTARSILRLEIEARLREIDHVHDARIAIAIATLTSQEREILGTFAKYHMEQTFWLTTHNLATLATLPRLLDKQIIRTAGITHDGYAMFKWTELGKILADRLDQLVPRFNFAPVPTGSTDKQIEPENGAT
jgi:hypothetical protein